jgi:hypothetical protein
VCDVQATTIAGLAHQLMFMCQLLGEERDDGKGDPVFPDMNDPERYEFDAAWKDGRDGALLRNAIAAARRLSHQV